MIQSWTGTDGFGSLCHALIMFKNGGGTDPAGRALVDMLDGCQHRGPDSTGFALYGDALDGELRLTGRSRITGRCAGAWCSAATSSPPTTTAN